MIEYQQNFHVNKITQKVKIKYIFDFVNEISVYKIRLHSAKPQSIKHIECKIFSLNCLIFSFEINIFFLFRKGNSVGIKIRLHSAKPQSTRHIEC
jgi:hypothetical protein